MGRGAPLPHLIDPDDVSKPSDGAVRQHVHVVTWSLDSLNLVEEPDHRTTMPAACNERPDLSSLRSW